MSKLLLIILMLILIEIILAFLFAAIAQVFYKRAGIDFKSIFKGFIERLFLSIALINDLGSALTFFSALKLATWHRLPLQFYTSFSIKTLIIFLYLSN
jgi:hypothetical protein